MFKEYRLRVLLAYKRHFQNLVEQLKDFNENVWFSVAKNYSHLTFCIKLYCIDRVLNTHTMLSSNLFIYQGIKEQLNPEKENRPIKYINKIRQTRRKERYLKIRKDRIR